VSARGLLIDSGPLVALLSERDQHHAVCRDQAKNLRGPFHTAWPVITEAAHLLSGNEIAVQKLLAWVQTEEIKISQLDAADVVGIADILRRYSDQGIDFADATLMHLADRDAITAVFTVDKRHFSVFRTNSRKALSVFL
jgi:predicted nucleic acid-binding protein